MISLFTCSKNKFILIKKNVFLPIEKKLLKKENINNYNGRLGLVRKN